jgi:hypothetical protein
MGLLEAAALLDACGFGERRQRCQTSLAIWMRSQFRAVVGAVARRLVIPAAFHVAVFDSGGTI